MYIVTAIEIMIIPITMTTPIRTMRGSGKIWYIVEAYIEQIILMSFSTKFSENLPNELKITKNSDGYGQIQAIGKKRLAQNCSNFWNYCGSTDICILY